MIHTFDNFDLSNTHILGSVLTKVSNHKELGMTPCVVIQTPTLKCIEDLAFSDTDTKSGHFKVSGKKAGSFKEYIDKFDAWVINHLGENSQEIFGKTLSVDSIAEKYKSSISDAKNLRLYLPRTSRGIKLTVMDSKRNPLEVQGLDEGADLVAAIRCRKIVIYKREILPQWEILMAMRAPSLQPDFSAKLPAEH
jgi:hypothetical protein